MEASNNKLPEANIEAEIKKRLDKLGIPSYLQLKFKLEDSYNLIADVTICNDDKEVLGFIEVKSHKSAEYFYKLYNPEDEPRNKQIKKYQSTGYPVFEVGKMNSIDQAINYVKELYRKGKTLGHKVDV